MLNGWDFAQKGDGHLVFVALSCGMLKRAFQVVWFYYFYLALGLWFTLSYPVLALLISRPQWYPYAYKARSWLSRWFLKLNGIRVKVTDNRANHQQQPYILCSNHFSELDILVLLSVFSGRYAFLGKQTLAQIPLFGRFFKALDVTVNRKDAAKASTSFKAAIQHLRNGSNIVIFPEGGIKGEPPRLHSFKQGAFRLAQSTQTSLLPVTINHTWRVLHPSKAIGWPQPVSVILHPALGVTDQPMEDLQQWVRHQIEGALTQ